MEHVKKFGQFEMLVSYGGEIPDEVEIMQPDLAWKYHLTVYQTPKQLAKDLRRAADWLDTIPLKGRKR